MNSLRTALVVGLGLLVGGCTKDEPAKGAAPAELKVNAPAVRPQAAAVGGGDVHGTVAERLEVPNYTYLRLTTPGGETWAAVPTTSIAVGTEVTIRGAMPMEHFESKTLNRTFDVILFASGAEVGPAGAAVAAPAADPHAGMAAPVAAPAVDLAAIKVVKAAGPDGRTVAEVVGQKATLKDKQVVVRARVVKVTNGVMGSNWLHVRDGSGTDAAQDNDLVVTTKDTAAMNDEITITGVVHTDKDLGSGYAYKVLIEDAKLTK